MIKPVASILCITYNHVQYIRPCLESLVNQICDFPFEILIYDDASTDGTQEVIKEFHRNYPNLIKPILRTENQWSKKPGVIDILFNNPQAKGDYFALCEGDDFWVGQDKLQKQVKILEEHPEYSVTCGAYLLICDDNKDVVCQKKWKTENFEDDTGRVFEIEDLSKNFFIKTSTTLFRNCPELFSQLKKYEYCLDIHIFYLLLKTGKGYYSKEILAGYNRHNGGVYSGRSPQELLLAHYYIFKEIYEKDKNKFIREQYLELSYKLINLRVSGLMPSSKIQTPELKAKIVTARKVYKDIKPILKTKNERNRLYKSLIPLQLKILKGKAVNLIFNK